MRRILLIDGGQLIGDMVKNLFLPRKDFQIKVICPCDWTSLEQILGEYQPNAVLIDDCVPWDCMAASLQTLKRFPRLRLILVCSQENRLVVYSSEELPITGLGDFFSFILGQTI